MNTNKYSKIALLLIIGLLTNCSAKVKSIKSPEFNQKVTRILFTLENKSTDEGPGDFFDAFSEAFIAELKNRNIECIEAKESKLTEEIGKFNPDVVMPIIQTKAMHGYSPQGGEYIGGARFEIKMHTPANADKPLWTAQIKVTGDLTSAAKAAAKKTVANLIEKLEADGIINVIPSK